MTHTELETAYIALCDDVIRQAVRIAAKSANSGALDAGNLAALLVDHVNNAKQQHLMANERVAGSYDLAALSVNASVPSNSETGWERED